MTILKLTRRRTILKLTRRDRGTHATTSRVRTKPVGDSQPTPLTSKVNFPHTINFGALCAANLVMQPSDIRALERHGYTLKGFKDVYQTSRPDSGLGLGNVPCSLESGVRDLLFSSLLLSSLELSDTKVYEPYRRARLGTASHQ